MIMWNKLSFGEERWRLYMSDCTVLYCLTVQYCIVWLYNIVLSDCTILYYLTVRCCFVSLYNIKLCDCTILYYLTVQNDTVWLYNIVGPTAFYSKYSTWCDTGGWLNLHCNFFHISQFSLNNWTQFLLGFPKESEQCLRDVDIVLSSKIPPNTWEGIMLQLWLSASGIYSFASVKVSSHPARAFYQWHISEYSLCFIHIWKPERKEVTAETLPHAVAME